MALSGSVHSQHQQQGGLSRCAAVTGNVAEEVKLFDLPRLNTEDCLVLPVWSVSSVVSTPVIRTPSARSAAQCPKMRNMPNAASKIPTTRKNIFIQLKGYFPAMAPV